MGVLMIHEKKGLGVSILHKNKGKESYCVRPQGHKEKGISIISGIRKEVFICGITTPLLFNLPPSEKS